MNRKLLSFFVLLIWVLSTLACLPGGLLGGKEAAQPTPEISKPTAVAPTAPPAATPIPSADDHMERGMEYYERGEYDEAVAKFQAAIELEPDDAGTHRNLGTAYLEQGKYEEAAAAYEKAIELDPDFGEAYGDLAGAYVNLGRLSEAIAAGEKAIELAPDYAMAYNNLGFAYYTQGMLDEAIAEYQEAIRINPDLALPHKNLGLAYRSQGRVDEAIVEFEAYLQLIAPDAPDRAAVEEEIAKLKEQAAAPGAEYRNAAGGYSLRYLEGWYYTEDEAQVIFAESEEALEAAPEKAPMVIFIAGPLSEIAESLDLEEITDPVVALEAMAENLEAETGEVEKGKVADYPAALIGISGTFKGVSYQGGLAVVLVEERAVYGVTLAPPDQWEDVRPTFVDMVNSLSFFELTAAEEQPAEAEPSAAAEEEEPASGVPTSVPNLTGLPLLDDAEEVYCMDEYNLNYWTSVDLVTALTFYRQELPALGWQLDYQDGKCLDDRRLTRRCMGWHGGYDNPEETPLFFLRGDGEYLTLNASEEGGRVNIIISIDPDVYAD